MRVIALRMAGRGCSGMAMWKEISLSSVIFVTYDAELASAAGELGLPVASPA